MSKKSKKLADHCKEVEAALKAEGIDIEHKPIKPRVFVLQKQSKYDPSVAKEYADEIVYIADNERINPFNTESFVELIKHRLTMENFNPEYDFICLTGPSVLLAMFMGVLTYNYFHYGKFKVLIFDARKNKYALRILEPETNRGDRAFYPED